MSIFCYFQDFYVLWSGYPLQQDEWVWLLQVTPPLLGMTRVGIHSLTRRLMTECLIDNLTDCSWPSSSQWISVPSVTALMTILYSMTVVLVSPDLKDWVVNCCWSSPAKWFYLPSPKGLWEPSDLLSPILNSSRLKLFIEIIAVFFDNHKKHTNTLWGKMQIFSLLKPVIHTVTTSYRSKIFKKNNWETTF